MFYSKYGLIAFYLSYLFPPEASTVIIKHLKRLNDFELSRDFYIKKCNLSKYIPYKYILNTSLHTRISSCPPSVIYSSVYKNNHQKDILKELNRMFSHNFENTSRMLTYICNNKKIYDFYSGHILNFWNHSHLINNNDYIIIDYYNYPQYSNILTYETKSSSRTKYFIKDDQYHYRLKYRDYDYPKKIKNKDFHSKIKNIHHTKVKNKRGFRRNY